MVWALDLNPLFSSLSDFLQTFLFCLRARDPCVAQLDQCHQKLLSSCPIISSGRSGALQGHRLFAGCAQGDFWRWRLKEMLKYKKPNAPEYVEKIVCRAYPWPGHIVRVYGLHK
jgi:hypothetical protein